MHWENLVIREGVIEAHQRPVKPRLPGKTVGLRGAGHTK